MKDFLHLTFLIFYYIVLKTKTANLFIRKKVWAMQDQRHVTIKSDRLRKVRNSLRQIIFLKLQELFNETDLSGSAWWSLMRPFRQSICSCSICGAIDRDMVYHAKSHTWNCIECNSIFIKPYISSLPCESGV